MIITRTPFRVSFFGGGTDYPTWFRKHGGSVLATTIDKYCYISCRKIPPFFEHKHRIVYSNIENVREIDEIQHPSVKAVFKWAKIEEGLEVHHDADLPARSGLGSSSAFTVGLAHAMYCLRGKMVSKQQLAQDAIHLEQNLIGEAVGSQDQVSAAYGGFNRIEFYKDESFEVVPIIISSHRQAELSSHLMLFFTGFSRIAAEIAAAQLENFKTHESELRRIGEMVEEAIAILMDARVDIAEFGKLLDLSWGYKRTLSSKISPPQIEQIYDDAKRAGAIGGKLLGAGGGGFMLLFVKPENQALVRARLKNLVFVPFKFENSGSKVVLFQPNGL
jgi:D-glycero-alpha-D-manno-heptose-7-phosphate kinase